MYQDRSRVAAGGRDVRVGTAPRAVRNILVSIVLLVVMIAGGGAGYTWYNGQHVGDAAIAPAPAMTKAADPVAAPQPAPNARVSASVSSLTTPVKAGDNASIYVKTLPMAVCKIKVEYNKVPAKDSGLVDKTADEFGIVTWTWTVDKVAPTGKWPVDVTCSRNDKSAMVRGDLVID